MALGEPGDRGRGDPADTSQGPGAEAGVEPQGLRSLHAGAPCGQRPGSKPVVGEDPQQHQFINSLALFCNFLF